jgi:hypothetical protein
LGIPRTLPAELHKFFQPLQALLYQGIVMGDLLHQLGVMHGLLMIEHQGESGDAKATAELATEIEKATAATHLAFGQRPQADQGQRQKHHHGAAAPLDQWLIQAVFAGASAPGNINRLIWVAVNWSTLWAKIGTINTVP